MQVLGRLFDHVLTRARRARDHRGRHLRRHRLGGDRGVPRPRAGGHRDPASRGPHQRGAAAADDHGARANVGNIAVDGTFDDCQDLVKAMFADAPFRAEMRLSAVNSINWARIAAQIPYYVASALALGAPEREVAFSVPTGNFGNVLAAWAARRMGLPVARLVVGQQPQRHPGPLPGRQRHEHARRSSPACRPAWTSRSAPTSSACCSSCWTATPPRPPPPWQAFRATGRMAVPHAAWHRATAVFHGFRLDDAGTLAEIRRLDASAATWPTRTPPSASPPPARCRAATCPRSPRRPRTRPSSPTPWSGHRPAARRCHRASPTYMTGRNASRAAPNSLDASRGARSAAFA